MMTPDDERLWIEKDRERLIDVLERNKSITAEAVAKEAARWREAAQEVWDHGHCTLKLSNLLKSSDPDWLAKHDAELLRPWREAVEKALSYSLAGHSTGCDCLESPDKCAGKCFQSEMRALLSPAPAPSSEKI